MLAVTRTGLKLGTDCHRSCRNISLQNLLAAVLPFMEKFPPPRDGFWSGRVHQLSLLEKTFQLAFAGCISCPLESNPSLLSLRDMAGKILKENSFRAGRNPFPKLARQGIYYRSSTESSRGRADVMSSDGRRLPRVCPSCRRGRCWHRVGQAGGEAEEGSGAAFAPAMPSLQPQPRAADLCGWIAAPRASGLDQEQARGCFVVVVVELEHRSGVTGGVLVRRLRVGYRATDNC